ncbi:MAG: hypothetical protein WCT19_03420 [Candidatus Paceibacterota bacterium]|jgi:hypothetical protein
MDNTATQNISIQKPNKSMFWKVGMIFVSYYLALVLIMIPASLIWFFVFIGGGHSVADLVKIDGSYSFIFSLVVLIAGLVGIRYGVRYISRKAIIEQKDIAKIIVWFVIIEVVLQLIYISHTTLLSVISNLLILAVDCFAIRFFFRKSS